MCFFPSYLKTQTLIIGPKVKCRTTLNNDNNQPNKKKTEQTLYNSTQYLTAVLCIYLLLYLDTLRLQAKKKMNTMKKFEKKKIKKDILTK